MVAALSAGWRPKDDSISVTALIGPPRIRTLTMKHWDDLEEDVSARLWALLGQGLHGVLAEYAAKQEVLAEQGIRDEIDGVVISGRPDFYDDGVIGDYKMTSVFSFLLGDKPEWTNQLNVYAHLFRSAGFPVRGLNVHAILRDFVESKSFTDPDYPKIPFTTVFIDLWSPGDCLDYIKLRVKMHVEAPMEPCSERERWARPNTFAVMREGGKRALRVLDTLPEAQVWGNEHHIAKPKDKLTIVERKGGFTRCERYCAVRGVCDCNPYNAPATESEGTWEEL